MWVPPLRLLLLLLPPSPPTRPDLLHRHTHTHTKYSSHLALLFVCVFSPSTRLDCCCCSSTRCVPFLNLVFLVSLLYICSVPAAASAEEEEENPGCPIRKRKGHVYILALREKQKGGNSFFFSLFPSVLVSSQSTTGAPAGGSSFS